MTAPNGTPKIVAKVTVEAPVVSFRYPHFLIGRQPSFAMPPPSTIFGHVASALGEWPTKPLQFAYAFRCNGGAGDLEHQQIINRTSGKFPGDLPDPLWRQPEPAPGKKLKKSDLMPRLLQKTTEAVVQPHTRDFLFDARMELYLDPPELAEAFRSPVFTVVLGRSQDLASVQKVEVIELSQATNGYLERTILPSSFRPRLPWGVTTLMPRYIGPAPQREPAFAPYIVLQERVYVGEAAQSESKKLITINGIPDTGLYCDPVTPEDRVGRRLLWFHTLDPAEFGHDKLG